MDSNEELYNRLTSLRKVFFEEIEKWPEHTRRQAALYTLKMLVVEMEYLPELISLYRLRPYEDLEM